MNSTAYIAGNFAYNNGVIKRNNIARFDESTSLVSFSHLNKMFIVYPNLQNNLTIESSAKST